MLYVKHSELSLLLFKRCKLNLSAISLVAEIKYRVDFWRYITWHSQKSKKHHLVVSVSHAGQPNIFAKIIIKKAFET